MKLKILKAQYGTEGKWEDVTAQVAGAVKNDQLWLTVSNSLFGDPVPGRVKALKIDYSVGSVSATVRFSEGELASLRTTSTKRLGIFYTTNAIKLHIIQQSLASIKKATENTPVDILVSTWSPVEDNPFPEFLSPVRQASHLTMYLQILQLLYQAQSRGQYTYVSFLEHDVLYPEDYFSYPDFEKVIQNSNYIGVCLQGFQASTWKGPLHQLTMRLDVAIPHFEGALRPALLGKVQNVEPYDLGPFGVYATAQPAVHINRHGQHLTSHPDTFGPPEPEAHPYWGKHEDIFRSEPGS